MNLIIEGLNEKKDKKKKGDIVWKTINGTPVPFDKKGNIVNNKLKKKIITKNVKKGVKDYEERTNREYTTKTFRSESDADEFCSIEDISIKRVDTDKQGNITVKYKDKRKKFYFILYLVRKGTDLIEDKKEDSSIADTKEEAWKNIIARYEAANEYNISGHDFDRMEYVD